MRIDVSQSQPNLRVAVRAALERLSPGGSGQNGAMENRRQASAPTGISHPDANEATLTPPSLLRGARPSSTAVMPLQNREISK